MPDPDPDPYHDPVPADVCSRCSCTTSHRLKHDTSSSCTSLPRIRYNGLGDTSVVFSFHLELQPRGASLGHYELVISHVVLGLFAHAPSCSSSFFWWSASLCFFSLCFLLNYFPSCRSSCAGKAPVTAPNPCLSWLGIHLRHCFFASDGAAPACQSRPAFSKSNLEQVCCRMRPYDLVIWVPSINRPLARLYLALLHGHEQRPQTPLGMT